MSLLNDLKSEHHNFLLEEGNLKKKQNWTGENQWTFLGYFARVDLYSCACGTKTPHLVGICTAEQTPSGSRREKFLDLTKELQFPLQEKHPISLNVINVKTCPYCLTTKGFYHG